MANPFLDLCAEFQISTPAQVPGAVTRAFSSAAHENVLFMALGYDYWFNPADLKASGIYQTFLMRSGFLELNLSNRALSAISSIWFDPRVAVKKENGVAVDLKMQRNGGVIDTGVANFNLCTKSMDVVAGDFVPEFRSGIAKQIKSGNGAVSGVAHDQMVECYKDLRNWWSDGDLTKIGLTAR